MKFHELILCQFSKMVDDPLIWAFVWVVIFDIATGISKSFVAKKTAKKTNSTKGLSGLIKHLMVMLLILTIYPFLNTIGFSAPSNTIVVFYLLVYVVSIIENLGQMGVPFPEKFKKYFTKLQDDYNKEDIE